MTSDSPLFHGRLVRLVALEPEKDSGLIARWMRDTEYSRQLDMDAARMWSEKKVKEWFEKELGEQKNTWFEFTIRALVDDRPIGFIGLEGIDWANGDSWVGIGIGEAEYRGKGYGTDAMQVILGFAFRELNLHRVSLSVFEYNPRAIRSYEKAGFRHEGRLRAEINRDGRRWDVLMMGILRTEWEAQRLSVAELERK
jgi:RimJ/RimL family protein N-acetyltransferase